MKRRFWIEDVDVGARYWSKKEEGFASLQCIRNLLTLGIIFV